MKVSNQNIVSYRTLAQPFEEQVTRTPNATALISKKETLTYRELNERANQLAHFLRKNGINQGCFIGVYMERSIEMIIAIYSITKIGGTYVPLDPELPHDRIEYMLKDATIEIVLTNYLNEGNVPIGPWKQINIEKEYFSVRNQSKENLACEENNQFLAYLLYTSGSTGRPKAVAFPVEGALIVLFWMQRNYPIAEGESILQKTPFGFDISVLEIFWTLYVGGKLIICDPTGHRDPLYIAKLISSHKVVAINFIPSMLQMFLNVKAITQFCSSLRWVFCGGEALTPHLRDRFYSQLAAKLINLYGPTEAGVVSHFVIEKDDESPTVPLGWPTADYDLLVLDKNLNSLSVGEEGELYIAADIGLARGYYRHPDLTAEMFLPNPFGTPGSRMYKTGDLVRKTSAKGLEYLGRANQQVKINGLRVEFGEIEAVLIEIPEVKDAVVLARDTKRGNKHLIAYVLLNLPTKESYLKSKLREKLPVAMIPTVIVFLEEWPLSNNGKLDRLKLPAPEEYTESDNTLHDATELELVISDIWASVLGHPPSDVNEDFFLSGGDSLLALQLLNLLRELSGLDITLTDIVNARTLRALSSKLNEKFSELEDTYE